MKIKTKIAFVIPAGIIVNEKMMIWIKNNCIKFPDYDLPDYDLPDGFEALFPNFNKKIK